VARVDRAGEADILGPRLTYLGRVYAPDRDAVEAKAIEEFKLREIDRQRLVIHEQP
jgi:hypothetical protein